MVNELNGDFSSANGFGAIIAPPMPKLISWAKFVGLPRLVVALAFMASTALLLRGPLRSEVLASRQPLSSLPMQFEDWKGQDVGFNDIEIQKIIEPQDFLLRDYKNASQSQPSISLFIDYSPMRFEAQLHSEEKDCVRGSGFVLRQQEIVQIARPDGSLFPVNRDVFSSSGGPLLVVYWYQGRGRAEASRIWARYHLMADSLRINRSDGALVRLSTAMNPDENLDVGFARIMRFGSNVIPMLDRYIPQ